MLRKSLILAAAAFAFAFPAMAADIPPLVVATAPPPPPVAVAPAAFGWGGVYVGLGAGVLLAPKCVEECQEEPTRVAAVYGTIGWNIVNGNFLIGVNGDLGVAFWLHPECSGVCESVWGIGLNVRAGVLLGARALVYGEAGVVTPLPIATPLFLLYNVGGGLELALGDRTSVFVEAKAFFDPNGAGYLGTFVGGGINLDLPGVR